MMSRVKALTRDRVRQDVDLVARAGLDVNDFLDETIASVQRAVPWVAACLCTHDPATHLLTSARKFGHLVGREEHDEEFGLVEYGAHDDTSFAQLAGEGRTAAGVHLSTGGEVERSHRMAAYMAPRHGYADEVRVLFEDGSHVWGAMALFRGSDDPPFSLDEVDFLASLTRSLATGVRTGLVSRLGRLESAEPSPRGAAVVILDATLTPVMITPPAERVLASLSTDHEPRRPEFLLSSLAAAARRYAAGDSLVPARSRLLTVDGFWLVAQASVLGGGAERDGLIAVTLEEARPHEIVGLLVNSFGLLPREREVAGLVLQGMETKSIAAHLHISAYTVQDHLKAIFEKTGVRSRRELLTRIYFDQYVPRLGRELSPNGWFL